MKRIAVLVIVLTFGCALVASAAYCPGGTLDPYLYLCTATDIYSKGQPIAFMLFATKVPLVIGPLEHPWKIFDSNGDLVYVPSSTPPTTWPGISSAWSDVWNQTDNAGKQVHKGTYSIVMPNMPTKIWPVEITITNMQ